MLDLKLIRDDAEGTRAALARRDPALAQALDAVIEKDTEWRAATASAESLMPALRLDLSALNPGHNRIVESVIHADGPP